MSIQFEHSVVIDRPVDEVYRFTSNADNDTQWMPWLDHCEWTEGPEPTGVADGQKRHIAQTDFGVRTEIMVEATDVIPGRKYTFETVEGSLDVTVTYEYESLDGRTRVTRSYDARPTRFIDKLFEPITALIMKRRWRNDFARLKEVLEESAVATPAD